MLAKPKKAVVSPVRNASPVAETHEEPAQMGERAVNTWPFRPDPSIASEAGVVVAARPVPGGRSRNRREHSRAW